MEFLRNILYGTKAILFKMGLLLSNTTIYQKIAIAIAEIIILLGPLYINFLFILIFIILDVVLGIIASIKKGEVFTSKKFKKGLLEKTTSIALIFIIFLMLEFMIMNLFNYHVLYITGFITILICLYEVSSNLEKLIIIYPNMRIIRTLSKYVLRTEKKLDKFVDKKINKVLDDEE